MGTEKRNYERQFKEEAVRLVLEGGRKVKDVAENLGINAQVLSKWKQRYVRSSRPNLRNIQCH